MIDSSRICCDAREEEIYRLVQRIEIIQEALIWYEGALGDEGRAVDEIRALLEDTVEMLQRVICVDFSWYTLQSKEDLTTEVPKFMDLSSNLSTMLIENSEPCFACGRNQNDRESFRCNSPSSQRLLDQGKCPRQG